MKKVMASLTLFSLGLLVAPVSVKAADVEKVEPNEGYTKVEVEFAAGTTNLGPVNPDHPSAGVMSPNPGSDNVKPTGTGPSLIYVSPSMKFQDAHGKATISLFAGKNQEYFAKVIGTDTESIWNNNFIVEIADGRGADASWGLQVTSDGLKQVGSDKSLTGAQIDWPIPKIINSNDDTQVASKEYAADEVHSLSLDSSKPMDILSAKGNGAGITTAQFSPKDIKLKVPTDSIKTGTYSTKLTWALKNIPEE